MTANVTGKTPKEIVLAFYESDSWKNTETLKTFLHPEYEQFWNAEGKFVHYNYDEVVAHGKDLASHFGGIKINLSHVLVDNDWVTLRYIFDTSSPATPEDFEPHAIFIAMWQVKEGKLYRCYEVSATPTGGPEELASFR